MEPDLENNPNQHNSTQLNVTNLDPELETNWDQDWDLDLDKDQGANLNPNKPNPTLTWILT